MLARLLQVNHSSQRCTGRFRSVCRKNACMSLFALISRVRIPPCAERRIAGGSVLSFGTQARGSFLSRAYNGTFDPLSFRCDPAMRNQPCPRMDTALSRPMPKARFPHRNENAQIFSRCFCMNGNGTILLLFGRNPYHEKNGHQ